MNCKHCQQPVKNVEDGQCGTHIHTNLGRCNPAESGLPYGYNGCPEGNECTYPCIGYIGPWPIPDE